MNCFFIQFDNTHQNKNITISHIMTEELYNNQHPIICTFHIIAEAFMIITRDLIWLEFWRCAMEPNPVNLTRKQKYQKKMGII